MPLKRRGCTTPIQQILRLAVLGAMLALDLAACAPSGPAAQSQPRPTRTVAAANGYIDAKLGFALALPTGWSAIAYPGQRSSSANSAVVLRDPAEPAALITLGVIRGDAMPAAFAARGTPSIHIGPYPAFSVDTTTAQGRVPCDVRIMLAGHDSVLAEWCSMDAADHAAQLEQILAAYQPAPAGVTPPAHVSSPPDETCPGMQQAFGYDASLGWGRSLAAPDATSPFGGWGSLAPGVYVCSNTGSTDPYLFQCTELVNRFDLEIWGLGHIPGNAARYFDYYQDGARHPGDVRDLPAGTYAFSDDANQGTSAFKPQPGDLLVFQDVRDPRVGWTSGLTTSPGHIALITAVDASHVYVAQENYNDRHYFLALPLTATSHGYHITDGSGIANRIVRGWIRFTLP